MELLLIQVALLLVLPFPVLWIILRIKAFWSARRGPCLFQPFHDIVRLCKKGAVFSKTTSLAFRLMPSVHLAALLTAVILVPMSGRGHIASFEGDFVLFAYLLAAARFSMIAGALETGSPFEGMGASREAAFAVFAEPAFFMLAGAMVLAGGKADFVTMVSAFDGRAVLTTLAVLSLFIMVLLEGARSPVDDPATHLELTMIHEAMILDHSGPDLAMLQYGAALKTVLVSSLLVLVVLPEQLFTGSAGPWLRLASTAGGVCIVAALIGTLESFMARLRMTHVPQFVLLMFSVSLVALVSVLLLF